MWLDKKCMRQQEYSMTKSTIKGKGNVLYGYNEANNDVWIGVLGN